MFGQLTGIYLVLFHLAPRLLLRRSWWFGRRSFFRLEAGIRHAQQSIKGRLDIASTGHQHRLDDLGVYARKGFNQRVLGLLLGTHWARWLRWRDLGCVVGEAYSWFGRPGGRRWGCDVFGGGRGCVDVVVKVELAGCGRGFGARSCACLCGLRGRLAVHELGASRGTRGCASSDLVAYRFLRHNG
jgi:hypothetical protein